VLSLNLSPAPSLTPTPHPPALCEHCSNIALPPNIAVLGASCASTPSVGDFVSLCTHVPRTPQDAAHPESCLAYDGATLYGNVKISLEHFSSLFLKLHTAPNIPDDALYCVPKLIGY